MSDTQAPATSGSTLRRLLRTPLQDLLRGRLVSPSQPATVKSVLATSGLPAPAVDLIARVTRRTRLWRAEQVEVATELVSHFVEGLDAGATIDELLSRFGPERPAAALIRRAKRRNRPLWWQAWRMLGYLALALGAFYAILAAYYFTGRPAPAVDYVTILNRPIVATPEDQRAWPLYRQALLDLRLTHSGNWELDRQQRLTFQARPGSKRWPALVAWVHKHSDAIERIHRAADRPHLGFVLGAGGSAYDPAIFPGQRASDGGGLYDVTMPALSPLRQLATILAADAAVAQEAGDRPRFLRDVRSLLNMADQLPEHPSLVAQLVGVGIRALTYEQLGRCLASERVAMLTDHDLRDLAHRLAGPHLAYDFFDVRFERMFFHDAVQRMFTAGGPGGGRLTQEGLWYARRMTGVRELDTLTGSVPAVAAQPASLLLVAPRREIVARYDRLLDRAEAMLRKPIRTADWDAWDQDVTAMKTPFLASIRNYPIGLLLPSLRGIQVTAERCLGMRDGLLCAIALETYRRRHDNAYPPSLDVLAPGLLPAVPTDRITGDPLRYALKDGRPVVYSVGADRTDDGGTPPDKERWRAASWDGALSSPPPLAHTGAPLPTAQAAARGDWVLFPPPVYPEPPDDE